MTCSKVEAISERLLNAAPMPGGAITSQLLEAAIHHAIVKGPSGSTLTLTSCTVQGKVHLDWLDYRQALCIHQSTLDELSLDYSHLGRIELSDSHVAVVRIESCTVDHGVQIQKSTVGKLVLRDALINGYLDLTGSQLGDDPTTRAIEAASLRVSGSVFLRSGFKAVGELRFYRAEVEGSIDCSGGGFSAQRDIRGCLDFSEVRVGGSIYLRRGLTCTGGIDLEAVSVGNKIEIDDVTVLKGAIGSGRSLDLRRAVAQEIVLRSVQADGIVDLGDCVCRTFSDDLSFQNWDATTTLVLAGFEYQQLSPGSPLGLTERLAWLKRQPAHGDTSAYEQLARVYGRIDERGLERAVRYAAERQRHRSSDLRAVERVWLGLLHLSIGYGYKPGRALLMFLTLVILGFGVYHVTANHGGFISTHAQQTPAPNLSAKLRTRRAAKPAQPNTLILSLDIALPIVDLNEARKFTPASHTRSGRTAQWMIWFEELLGWLLAAMLAISLPKLIER